MRWLESKFFLALCIVLYSLAMGFLLIGIVGIFFELSWIHIIPLTLLIGFFALLTLSLGAVTKRADEDAERSRNSILEARVEQVVRDEYDSEDLP